MAGRRSGLGDQPQPLLGNANSYLERRRWRNLVIGSIAELEKLTNAKITDLHRHFIDDLTFTKNGKVFKRITEVFDCWFESGSMPYAQNHYPFENQKLFEENFPADFIGEGLDQTRGWFYTLTVLSAALFNKAGL